MFILKQTRQNRFSSYKVGEIRTTKVEFKLIKVGKLNIKKAFKILVGVFSSPSMNIKVGVQRKIG